MADRSVVISWYLKTCHTNARTNVTVSSTTAGDLLRAVELSDDTIVYFGKQLPPESGTLETTGCGSLVNQWSYYTSNLRGMKLGVRDLEGNYLRRN